jgi:hypothetical protein
MGDGSFNRSAGNALARGVVLIVAAVLIGIVLLRSTDGSEPFRNVAEDDGGADGSGDPSQPGGDGGGTTSSTAAPATARDPAQVTVLVANGSGVKGAAQRIADTLKASNYVTAQPVNTTARADASAVYYVEGYEPDARAVAKLLNPAPNVAAMPNPLPVADLAGSHVLVVVATDLAAR